MTSASCGTGNGGIRNLTALAVPELRGSFPGGRTGRIAALTARWVSLMCSHAADTLAAPAPSMVEVLSRKGRDIDEQQDLEGVSALVNHKPRSGLTRRAAASQLGG